jgi:hypothetical protein
VREREEKEKEKEKERDRAFVCAETRIPTHNSTHSHSYKPPSNVFDDIDEGYTAPKWREYKAPSNVFDELPELANADHKVPPPPALLRLRLHPAWADAPTGVGVALTVGGKRTQR